MTFEAVVHPSDFSAGDVGAFAHALRVAVAAEADLDLIHVAGRLGEAHSTDFPKVRATLERWADGSLAGFDGTTAIRQFRVEKVIATGTDPLLRILQFVEHRHTGLVVLSTHQRRGLDRWLHRSLAEPLARCTGVATLFVPRQGRGFVSAEDGRVLLRRVLVPVARSPLADAAVDLLVWLCECLGCENLEIVFLYVGDAEDEPGVAVPFHAGWTTSQIVRSGDVVEQIVAAEREISADLVVMATRGHDGFLDALRGDTTERVLREVACPLLAVPATA